MDATSGNSGNGIGETFFINPTIIVGEGGSMSDDQNVDPLEYTEIYQRLKQMEEKLNFVFLTTKTQSIRLKQVNFLQSLDFILVDPNDALIGENVMRFVPMSIFPADKVDGVKVTVAKMERDMEQLELDLPVEHYLKELQPVKVDS